VAQASSGGPEVRDDMWGPSVSRARREGEGGTAGGVFLRGRGRFGGVPPARGPAGLVVRPRPCGKRGGTAEKKEWAAAGPEVTKKISFLNKI
jgi:hypothetical protein